MNICHIILAQAMFLATIIWSTTTLHEDGTETPTATQHTAQSRQDNDENTLKQWKAGQQVSMQSVRAFGVERCFASTDISDATFSRIQGKSYKANCTVPRSQLRYLKLLHYTIDGKIQLGELVCNKDISADLIDIFRNLFEARYPIERMVLIDEYEADDKLSMAANNTTCFNFRHVAGSKVLSKHSVGKAVDINPLYNPYVKRHANGTLTISPKEGKAYANRSQKFNYKISRNDLCYKEFIKHGFQWGGDWRSLKDYQHFEKK